MSTPRITWQRIKGESPAFLGWLGALGLLIVLGLASAWTMEHHGHVITGMSNRIVWGLPHVFAVFMIVAASGALNVASIASVFGQTAYKPLAPLSTLLALALLVGGLCVLVLDLGRPDRLIVAMTTYNFSSIFAWNIYLYVGFIAVGVVYLWMMMERRMNAFTKPVGVFAFVWRLALTTGTGSIFGFLVARQAWDAAIMAPMFIAMSLAFGLAVFLLLTLAISRHAGRELGAGLRRRLARLLGIFAAVVLYFAAVQHLTNLYAAEHAAVERFILFEGGIYTTLFWLGQIGIGGVVPLVLIFAPQIKSSVNTVMWASVAVIIGGFAQLYVIIIGGQAFPQILFPGRIVESSFADGGIAAYAPSLPELGLGLGGAALALAIVTLAIKVLAVLPTTMADTD
jgi:molybdopterin-containing oxidoreductase family membrane subunit